MIIIHNGWKRRDYLTAFGVAVIPLNPVLQMQTQPWSCQHSSVFDRGAGDGRAGIEGPVDLL
jgi:hypothetical protein